MTWLALCDFTSSAFMDPKLTTGEHKVNNLFAHAAPPTGVGTGSLIVEVAVSAERTGQIVLLEYSAVGDWSQRFSLRMDPMGLTVLELISGEHQQKLAVATGASMRDRNMRITYSWDTKRQRSLLTIENLVEGVLAQVEKRTAIEFPVHIIERLAILRQTTRSDPATVFFGVSDRVEPVGLAATIASGAPVMTPSGPKAIEKLRVGDEVLTRDSGPQTVRWVGSRHVPTNGSFQPVRLSAPYFGLTHDLLVAPEQRLLVGGAEVEYLFGEEEILVEARHLVNGRTAFKETRFSAIRYFQVLLDNHEVIDVSGGSLESLYTGSICDDPELLETTMLAQIPAAKLPRHKNLVRPLLRSYEALSLRSALMV